MIALALAILLSAHARADAPQLDELNVSLPDAQVADSAGHRKSLRDFPGPKIVHLWASWCTSCKKEIPELAKLKSIPVIFVSVDDDPAKAESELKEIAPGTPFWQAKNEKPAKSLWSWGLPVSYVVNEKNTITKRALGARSWNDFRTDTSR